ncbi:MAG: SRPBCC family protein [Candidatus Nitrosotenuis sp.]
MPKFHLEKLIKAERQVVFDIVANYENYQNILPQYFPSIRVRSIRDNVAVVEEHLKLGERELVMTTKHVTKYPELHEIFVLGGDAKGSHIVEKYEKTEQGTRLTVDANIKLSGVKAIGVILAKKKISSDFDKIIDDFAKIAEKS